MVTDFWIISLFALQGTAVVALGGLLAALKVTGGTLADHKFLFLGAGEVLSKHVFLILRFECFFHIKQHPFSF